MSNAALLKVYDGDAPALAISGGAAATPDLEAVLGAGASAGNVAITALGDLSFGTGDAINGPAGANLTIAAAATRGLILQGANGASLVAATGGSTLEATAGALTLRAGAAAPGGLVLAGAGLPATAATSAAAFNTGNLATHYLAITIGATPYYIPLSAATW